MVLASLQRMVHTTIKQTNTNCRIWQGMISLGTVGVSHQYQQLRLKSKIGFCGYLEHAEFKKRDIRYQTSTRHDPKRISWHDYQVCLLIY